ncbi:MAG: glycosyltransferase [Eubacteriales bacterium]|nr:glycosyltransferase [Eubacteriales bacterium]MDZ7611080.1 glycosyltransferase [Eubacteriales bacterium]
MMSATISLCMIARNEAQNLGRCLNSVRDVVDEMIVIDTGSSDGTANIARSLGARVYSFVWNDNFSDARNSSLEMATGDWILFLDADEELAPESHDALRSLVNDETVDGYFVKIINYLGNEGWTETCPDIVFRLFRNRPEYRFRGAIHEQIADVILENNRRAGYRMAEDVIILHYGYLDRQISEKDKKNRNLTIIEKELGQNPENRMLRYHYGVELFRAERYLEAAAQLTFVANELDPATIFFPKLLRYIVMAYHSAGQPAKAIQVAGQALQRFPDYADLYYYAGLGYLELKQYARADYAFRKAVSMPEQPAMYAPFGGVRGFRSYYHLGHIAELFLNDEDALEYYVASINDNPNFTYAIEGILRILKPRENPEYTRKCLEEVFEFHTPRAHLVMGGMFFRFGAYGLALEYLEQGVGDSTISDETKMWKAICLLQEQRHLEALRILDEFGPGNPLYLIARLNKLLYLWVQGKDRKARALLAEIFGLGLAEDTKRVLSLIASYPDQLPESVPVTLGPDGVTFLLDIVKRLLGMGSIERAMYLLESTSIGHTGQALEIAQLLYDYGYREQAQTLLADPETNDLGHQAHFLLAEISREDEDFTEAERQYRFALETGGDEPRYYVRLINLYENRRREILAEARARYPDVETFQQLLNEVSV